jgi:hypothetical protein
VGFKMQAERASHIVPESLTDAFGGCWKRSSLHQKRLWFLADLRIEIPSTQTGGRSHLVAPWRRASNSRGTLSRTAECDLDGRQGGLILSLVPPHYTPTTTTRHLGRVVVIMGAHLFLIPWACF